MAASSNIRERQHSQVLLGAWQRSSPAAGRDALCACPSWAQGLPSKCHPSTLSLSWAFSGPVLSLSWASSVLQSCSTGNQKCSVSSLDQSQAKPFLLSRKKALKLLDNSFLYLGEKKERNFHFYFNIHLLEQEGWITQERKKKKTQTTLTLI